MLQPFPSFLDVSRSFAGQMRDEPRGGRHTGAELMGADSGGHSSKYRTRTRHAKLSVRAGRHRLHPSTDSVFEALGHSNPADDCEEGRWEGRGTQSSAIGRRRRSATTEVVVAVAAGSLQIAVFGLMRDLEFGFANENIRFFDFALPGMAVFLAICQLGSDAVGTVTRFSDNIESNA
jgi:hypothetical protein